MSTSDDEDDDDGTEGTPPASVAPTRTLPKRAAYVHYSADEEALTQPLLSTVLARKRFFWKQTLMKAKMTMDKAHLHLHPGGQEKRKGKIAHRQLVVYLKLTTCLMLPK